MGYNSINIEVTNKDTTPTFTIYSENDALLIGKNGKNLNALQTIIKETLKKIQRKNKKIPLLQEENLDCNSFHHTDSFL